MNIKNQIAVSMALALCSGLASGLDSTDNATGQGGADIQCLENQVETMAYVDEAPDPRILQLLSASGLDGIKTKHGLNIVTFHSNDGRSQRCIIMTSPVETDGERMIFAVSMLAKRKDVPRPIEIGLMNMNTIRRHCIWCEFNGCLAFRTLVPIDSTPEEFRKIVEFVALETDGVERDYLGRDVY